MSRCGCSAGSYENGWHETRSEECTARERDTWARTLDRFRAMPVSELRDEIRKRRESAS